MLLKVIDNRVVADALGGGKRRGDGGRSVVHIVTLVDVRGGHRTGRHGIAFHQTGDRVAVGRGRIVAHECRAVVDLRAVQLDGQRSRIDGQRVGAGGRGVVAVLSLHIHGQRALAHIGDTRHSSAPSGAAVGTVGNRGTRGHRRHSRVARRLAVVGLGRVNTIQGQGTAVVHSQLAERRVDVVVAGDVNAAAHHLDAGAEGVGHRAFGHVGDGARDGDARNNVAVVQGHIRAGGAGVALRAEGHLEAVVAVGAAVVGPVMVVGLDGQRVLDLLDRGGSRSLAAVGVGHLQAVGAVGQVADGVLAGHCPRLVSRSGTCQDDSVVGHAARNGVCKEAVSLVVAVAGRGVDRQGHRGWHGHAHLNRILVATEVFHIDLHRQGLLGSGPGDGGTRSRALRDYEVEIGGAHVRRDSLHAGGEVRIGVVAAAHIGGQRGGVARGNDRLGLIATLIGDGVRHRRAAVRDGVFALDFPSAIVAADNGLHGVHRQGLAAGGSVESLHGSLRREGRLIGVAGVHRQLVARPGARQSGSRGRGDVVGVGPVLRITAGTIRVGPGIGLGAGAAVVGAASHRTGHGKVTAIGSRGGRRRRHHGVGSAGDVTTLIGGQREVSLGDGIDIVPRVGKAGAVGISIGIGTCALAGERVRAVRRGGENTCDGLLTLARSGRDGGRRLSAVHTHHRLGSFNARGVHGRLRDAVDGIDILPYKLAIYTILVGIGIGHRTLATRDIFGSHRRRSRQRIAARILHHRQHSGGGSGCGTHTFHRIRSGHRAANFGRRRGALDGVGVGPGSRLVVTILEGIDKVHRTFAGHIVGGTGERPLVGDVVVAGILHCRHHTSKRVRGHRVGGALDGAGVGAARDVDGSRHTYNHIGTGLARTAKFVAVIDHKRIALVVTRRNRYSNCVVVNGVGGGNRIVMRLTNNSVEGPSDRINRGGHRREEGRQVHIADIGAHGGVLQGDGRHRMRGHSNRHFDGSRCAHTEAIYRSHRVSEGHGGRRSVYQILTVHEGLVRTGSIRTRDSTRNRLRRIIPFVIGSAGGTAVRRHHEGTARTYIATIIGNGNRKVVLQAHRKFGGGGTIVDIRHGHHIDSSVQTRRVVRVEVIHIRQVHVGVVGGGRIFVSVCIGVGLCAAVDSHQSRTIIVGTSGNRVFSRSSQFLRHHHGHILCNGRTIGCRVGGRDSDGVGACCGRRTTDIVARKAYTRRLPADTQRIGRLSCNLNTRNGIWGGTRETDVLRQRSGVDGERIAHADGDTLLDGTTILVGGGHLVGVVARSGRRGNHFGNVGHIQRAARGPAIYRRAGAITRRGRQSGAAVETDTSRVSGGGHTQLGRDDDVHIRGLFVVALVLHGHCDCNSLLYIGLRIDFPGADALAHEGGRAAAVAGSAERVSGEVGHLVSTVEGCRGGGVRQAGNHRLGLVVRPGVGHLHRIGLHFAGILVGGRPGHTSLASHALVECACSKVDGRTRGAIIFHGEIALSGSGTIPVAGEVAIQIQRSGDDRRGHLLPSEGDALRGLHIAGVLIRSGPHLGMGAIIGCLRAFGQGNCCTAVALVGHGEVRSSGSRYRSRVATEVIGLLKRAGGGNGNRRVSRALHGHVLGGAHLAVLAVLHGEFQFLSLAATGGRGVAGVGGGGNGGRGRRHRKTG